MANAVETIKAEIAKLEQMEARIERGIGNQIKAMEQELKKQRKYGEYARLDGIVIRNCAQHIQDSEDKLYEIYLKKQQLEAILETLEQ